MSVYTRDETLTAMCLWEAALELKLANKLPDGLDALWKLDGTVGMRSYILRHANGITFDWDYCEIYLKQIEWSPVVSGPSIPQMEAALREFQTKSRDEAKLHMVTTQGAVEVLTNWPSFNSRHISDWIKKQETGHKLVPNASPAKPSTPAPRPNTKAPAAQHNIDDDLKMVCVAAVAMGSIEVAKAAVRLLTK